HVDEVRVVRMGPLRQQPTLRKSTPTPTSSPEPFRLIPYRRLSIYYTCLSAEAIA
ncbi:hypothetical protein CCACVL1_01003, partial [Corchorus capsularis]